MSSYRTSRIYRGTGIYRDGMRAAKTYQSGRSYRKPDSYGGASSTLPIGHSSRSTPVLLRWDLPATGQVVRSARVRSAGTHAARGYLPWDGRAGRGYVASLRLFAPMPNTGAAALSWAELPGNGMTTAVPLQQLAQQADGAALRWGDFDHHRGAGTALPSSGLTPHAALHGMPWGMFAAYALAQSLLWRRIVERGGYVALPWFPLGARSHSTVVSWPPTPPVDDDTITIPDLPVYVMLPTMTAVRLPDRTPIPLLSASLQEEAGSFVWSFTAPMNRAGLALVNPDDGDPPQIEITINGYVWTFVVDAYDDNRRFGSNTLTLRGRSLGALLAAPHAPSRTFTQEQDRAASQLAAEELPVGWTLVWDAVDWLVPGGTFSYADLPPIEAIAQVASAIGASIQSDPHDKTLRVAPTYPRSPWNWDEAAPYAIVPASVIAEGSSSWKGGVNPDGVYVYAQNAASGAFVKITGSAGAVQLPMVVDPLLVHADAQRERGRHELATHGKVRIVQRTVPLFPTPAPAGMPELGVVRPGKLLEIEDTDETWLGMVTAVRIDAHRNGRAFSVRQHLTIERQYR